MNHRVCGGSKIVSVQILRSNLSLTESVWLRLLLRFARTRADIEVMLVEIWGASVPRVAAPPHAPARPRPPAPLQTPTRVCAQPRLGRHRHYNVEKGMA